MSKTPQILRAIITNCSQLRIFRPFHEILLASFCYKWDLQQTGEEERRKWRKGNINSSMNFYSTWKLDIRGNTPIITQFNFTYFVMLLLIPTSSASPPISQAILSMHSSDSIRARVMSWILSTTLAAAESSKRREMSEGSKRSKKNPLKYPSEQDPMTPAPHVCGFPGRRH